MCRNYCETFLLQSDFLTRDYQCCFYTSRTHPVINPRPDNTTAQCWTYTAASSADKGAKDLARINCALQLGARLGLHAVHIRGEDNIIADDISRIVPDSPFVSQLQTIVHRHPVLQNCTLYQVPQNLSLILFGLLSSHTDRPTITWKKSKYVSFPFAILSSMGKVYWTRGNPTP